MVDMRMRHSINKNLNKNINIISKVKHPIASGIIISMHVSFDRLAVADWVQLLFMIRGTLPFSLW